MRLLALILGLALVVAPAARAEDGYDLWLRYKPVEASVRAAYAAREEDVKGSLTPGKYADIVVLSRDILSVPEDQVPGTKVLTTIVGGKVVYERGTEARRHEGTE